MGKTGDIRPLLPVYSIGNYLPPPSSQESYHSPSISDTQMTITKQENYESFQQAGGVSQFHHRPVLLRCEKCNLSLSTSVSRVFLTPDPDSFLHLSFRLLYTWDCQSLISVMLQISLLLFLLMILPILVGMFVGKGVIYVQRFVCNPVYRHKCANCGDIKGYGRKRGELEEV